MKPSRFMHAKELPAKQVDPIKGEVSGGEIRKFERALSIRW